MDRPESVRHADRLDALLRGLARVEGLDEADREELLRLVRTRPLDHAPFPELLLHTMGEGAEPSDAAGECRGLTRLVATGCTAEGDPEPLGTVVVLVDDERSWAALLFDLQSRGFSGVQVVYSPAGQGVAAAVSTAFPGARFEPVPDDFVPPWLELP